MMFLLLNSSVINELSDLDTLSVVIACLCHDVGHPGVNNRFLINNREEIAITYNDISILENMHACVTFQVMNKK